MSTRLRRQIPKLFDIHRGTSRPSRTEVFNLLQNRRRRFALHYLIQQDRTVSLGELSDQVAAWENDTSVQSLGHDARQRVYVSLRQLHLPHMDRVDVIEFDESAGTVELSENASTLRIYLETVPEGDILWAQYYLGVSGISAAFVLLVWLDMGPFARYQLIVWLVVVVVFFTSAVLHHLYLRRHRLGIRGPPPSEL